MARAEDQRVEDDDSDRSSDEDFNMEGDAPEEDIISSSEEEQEQAKPAGRRGRKPKRPHKQETEVIELDSGDEATIQEKRKKRRKGEPAEYVDDEEEGGEGLFVKTRSQRKIEQREQRPLVNTLNATIDVDSVWARLAALPVSEPVITIRDEEESQTQIPEDEYILIKRTTKYAGQVTTEERRVHKHSAEARIYLKEQEDKKRKEAEPDENAPLAEEGEDKLTIRRPLKRLSRFEPNPNGEVKSLPPHLQLRWPRTKIVAALGGVGKMGPPRGIPRPIEATKLTTVEKSRHDWAGFVDQAGIADELDEHGKSKSSYLDRTAFLNRTEHRQEDDRRDARMKGV